MSLRLRLPSSPAPAAPACQISSQVSSQISRQIFCQIFCQDYAAFLDTLPPNSADLLLTDPPYTISRETGFRHVRQGIKRFAVSMNFGAWDKKQIDLHTLSQSAYKTLRKGGTAIIWYDLWKISELASALNNAGFRMLRLLIWQKTNPVPLNSQTTYLSNSREIAILAVKGTKPTFNDQYHNGIYNLPIPRHLGNRQHPTQKPLDLFTELVEKHSNNKDLVIDPFLGAGTTALAAIQTGRKFQGCDIDKTYTQIAQQRVDACMQNLKKSGYA